MTRAKKIPVPALALFPVSEAPEPYKKAVPILHSKPRQSFSLLQRKSANALLKNALETEPEQDGFFEIAITKLIDDIDMNSNNLEHLKSATREMMNIVFEWDVLATRDNRIKWKASALFPEMELTKSHVRYQISNQMLPQLKRPEVYAMIDMAIVRKFKRPAALAIWEYGVRFEQVGKTTPMLWEEFRNMVLSDEVASKATYSEYKHFKHKQLKPSIAEINAISDHDFQLFEIKEGRNIHSLKFTVTRKRAASEGLDPEDLPTLRDLKSLGMKQDEATECIKQYGRDKVAAAVMATKRRANDKKAGPLQSPVSWLRWRLRSGSDETAEPPRAGEKPARQKVDFRERFLMHRRNEAEEYFKELSHEIQTARMEDYENWQKNPALSLKGKKKSMVAAEAFFRWLAEKTWGEPTPEQILEFAQENLAGPVTK